MRRPVAAGVAALVVLAAFIVGVPSAQAGPLVSQASGKFLAGTANGTDLSSIAGVAGASATQPGTAGAVIHPLDVTALNATGVGLGNGVALTGTGGVLTLGAVNQYAIANVNGSSASAAGAVTNSGAISVGGGGPQGSASINLTPLLTQVAAVSAAIDSAKIDVDAIASTATQTAGGAQSGTYSISGGLLTLHSPLVAGIGTTVTNALTNVSTTVNGLAGPSGTLAGALSSLSVLQPVLTALGLPLTVSATVTTDFSAVNTLLSTPLHNSDSSIVINLAAGTIVVDLTKLGGGLNARAANTEILSSTTLSALSTGVVSLLGTLVTSLNTALTASLNAATVAITANAGTTTGTLPTGVAINVSGTVAQIVAGTATATVVAKLAGANVVGLNAGAVLGVLGPVLNSTLLAPGGASSTFATALTTGITTPVANTLAPALTAINQLASLVVNAQTTVAARFTETALKVGLLPQMATPLASINLAASSVGANGGPLVPTASGIAPAAGPVAGGQSVVITGSDFTTDATVSVAGSSAITPTAITATSITFTSPAHAAGAVGVTVTTAGGTSTPALTYTYVPGPTASTLTPSSGPGAGGQTVHVTGTGFVAGSTVSVGGSSAITPASITATDLAFVTPAHAAGATTVTVTTPGGTTSPALTYTYVAQPTTASLTPTAGPVAGGQSVTVTGTGFVAGSTVSVDGGAPITPTSITATQIVFSTPAHIAGAATITVTNAGGPSTPALDYTYVAVPSAPSLSPVSGPVAGGQSVTITGTGFVAGSTVSVDGSAPITPTSITATQIVFSTPAHVAGAVGVTVTTVGGTTGSLTYTYLAVPTAGSLSPVSGPVAGGQSVTITGSGFVAGSTVSVGGGGPIVPTSITATQIVFSSPAHVAGSVGVTVTTPGGTSSPALTYTYIAVPIAASLSPTAGPTTGGQSVTITGSGFVAGSTVSVDGGGPIVPTSITATQIVFSSPAHVAGSVGVTVTTPGGTSSPALTYTYVAGPTTASLNPAVGPILGGQSVTITGSGFVAGATVSVDGGLPITPTSITATQIVFSSPIHLAGPVGITVTTTGGTSSPALTYTYAPAPTAASLSPTSGPVAGGQSVTITGSGFVAGSTVSVDGSGPITPTSITSTQIGFTTPAHAAGAVGVTVTTAGGSTLPVFYTYVAAPTTSALSPSAGPAAGGQTVTITGSGFTGATTVAVDAGAPITPTIVLPGQLTFVTPAHAAGAVGVTVTTAGGTTAPLGYTFVAAPVTTSLTPPAGPVAGGQTVTITGTAFGVGATVAVDGFSVSPSTVTSTQLTYVTPLHLAGAASVTVTTAGGTSSPLTYTYVPVPTALVITPATGSVDGGEPVTITGTGFVAGATVTVDGVTVVPTSISPLSIVFAAPAHAAEIVDVTVTTAGGTSAPALHYTYVPGPPVPTAASLSPVAGPLLGGQTVTVTGTGFSADATVSIDGGLPIIPTSITATHLTFLTPPHLAGPVSVSVTTVGGTTAPLTYDYLAAPTAGLLAPSSGPVAGGQSVTVTGTGFVTGTTVSVNGGAPIATTVVSPTELTFVTPAHASGLVLVTVSTLGGTSLALAYEYVAVPAAGSLNPSAGPVSGGQAVTITGSNFTADSTVAIDGGAPITPTVVLPSLLTFVTPAHVAGTVAVTVTTPGGISGGLAYDFVAVPAAAALNPSAGPVAGGQTVTITGSGFTTGAIVNLDGLPITPATVSGTTITFVTPLHLPGAVTVTVTTPGGITAPPLTYTYEAVPVALALNPTTGPTAGGQSVTITGLGFTADAVLTVGGASVTPTAITATTITFDTPAHAAGAVIVTVANAGGTTDPLGYTYVPTPTASALNPTAGPIAGGQSVTVTGTGFLPGATVTVDGVTVSSTTLSPTAITFTTPAHVAGTVAVTVSTPGGATSDLSYTYLVIPTAANLSPAAGPVAGGQSVTITGAGFTSDAVVSVGGSAVTPDSVTPFVLTLTTPAHAAGAVSVSVTTPGGTTGTLPYTYVVAPSAASLSPAAGPVLGGQSVTITGTAFTADATVSVDGGAPLAPVSVTSTAITFITPSHVAGPVSVTVTTPGGTTTDLTYEYDPFPVGLSLSPTSGSVDGGDLVTIAGTGFSTGATVTVDLTAGIVPLSISPTEIVFLTPAHSLGLTTVEVVTPGGTSLPLLFTYRPGPPVPTTSGLSPSAGPIGGGQSVTVTGTGFTGDATVAIDGGSPITPSAVSTGSLTFTTPAHTAGAVTVTVTTLGGTTGGLGYTFVPAPGATSLSPSSGPIAGGQSVTITGTGFTGDATVSVDGGAAITPSAVSPTEITFDTPAHAAGPVPVTVSAVGGTSGAVSYTYLAVPVTTSLSPSSGPIAGGQTVTVTGTGFTAGSTVSVDGGSAITPATVSPTEITFVTPAHGVGPVPVTVTTLGGTSSGRTYTYLPVPTVSALTPSSGPVGGSQSVTITGAGFTAGSTVSVDGSAPITPTSVTSTSIVFATPAHAIGPVTVTVSTNGGTSSGRPYDYVAAPALDSLDPDQGPVAGGQTVTVTGSGFTPGSTVAVDGGSPIIPTAITSTTVTFTTPAHVAGTVSVTVTASGGTSNGLAYDFLPPPTTSGLSPASGPVTGGQSVTITGANFTPDATVTVDGGPSITPTGVTATSIVFVSPTHIVGGATVAVTTPGGTSSGLGYTYVAGPTVSALSPSVGPIAGGQSVTVTGSGFTAGATVAINAGAPITPTSVTATTLVFLTPAHPAGAVSVTVSTVGGTSAAQSYTYVPAPTLAALTPPAGPVPGGQTVTVTGTDFTAGANVVIGGVTVTPTTVSATSLTFVTPAHAPGATSVIVTAAGGTSSPLAYTYLLAPTALAISPAAGPVAGGQSVTITGSGFTAGSTVSVDGGAPIAPSAVLATSLTFVTPAHSAAAVGITVSTAGGTTAALTYTFVAAPVLASLSPGSGPTLGGQTVTVTGSGFTSDTTVTVDGVPVSISSRTATVLRFTTNPHGAGPVDIAVTTPGGTATFSAAYAYLAVSDIFSLSPADGPAAGGQSVTITGVGFTVDAMVHVDGGPAITPTIVTPTSIVFTTPAHAAGSAAITVTSLAGSALSTLTYTYDPLPTIGPITPDAGPLSGGQVVTVTGTGFTPDTVATIDGVPVAVTVLSPTSLRFTTPAHSAGTVDVTITTGGGTATVTGGYAYQPVPSATTVSPPSGPTAGGQSVTIAGSGFATGPTVTVGGVAATVTAVTPTSITITTPAHGAGTVDVVVTTAGGTDVVTNGYSYLARPVATALSPASGPAAGGQTVTVTGSGFTTDSTVSVAGGAPLTPTSVSPTQLVFASPAHVAGAVGVTVTSPGGTSTPALGYTYVPPVTAGNVEPDGSPDTGGRLVTVTGTGFVLGHTSITIGGITLIEPEVTVVSSTELTFTTPAHPAGAVTITVTVDGATSTPTPFTYTVSSAPLPATIPTLSPQFGPVTGGQIVIGVGRGFVPNATTVRIGGDIIPADEVMVTSPTRLFFISPPHPQGWVTVTGQNGTRPDFDTANTSANVATPRVSASYVAESLYNYIPAGPVVPPVPAPSVPRITTPANGSSTTSTTPIIAGTSLPNAAINVTEGGVPVMRTVATATGTWSGLPFDTLRLGVHHLVATQTLSGGLPSAASVTDTFTVRPVPPTITAPKGGAKVTDRTPTISGRGTPGSRVTVRDGTKVLCSAVVRANGTWSCTPATALKSGGHSLTAVQTTGGVLSLASAAVRFSIPATASPHGSGTPTTNPTSGPDPTTPGGDGNGGGNGNGGGGLAFTGFAAIQDAMLALVAIGLGLLLSVAGRSRRRRRS